MKIIIIKLLGLLLFLFAVANADTWSNCEIKSVKLISENQISFRVFSHNCSPCDVTIYYMVEPSGWPTHSTSELKQYQAMVMAAMANNQRINIDFSWHGWNGDSYHVNWIEILQQ